MDKVVSLEEYNKQFKCEKCRTTDQYKGFPTVMGDAWCEKHNYRFPFYQEPCPPCPMCAKEEGLCIDCGDKLPKEEVITHGGADRAFKKCKCSACDRVEQCTPATDFYTKTGDPNGPLFCECCIMKTKRKQ